MTDAINSSDPPPDIASLQRPSSPIIPTKLSQPSTLVSQASSESTATTKPQSHLTTLQRDGYVQIPSLLPPHLLLAAQATSKYLVTRTRTGSFWPHVRTVPKQYPPWPKLDLTKPDEALNIWGVQHLLHPELEGLRDVYAEVYFSEAVLEVARELLAEPGSDGGKVAEDELVMELLNLLCSPGKEERFELCWHRDDIRLEVSPEEEERLLKEKAPGGRQLHAQYNIALFDDESLIVVPGSHRRVRSEAERNATAYQALPDEVRVKLKPGDAVFYDSNIFHRGVYQGIDEKNELGRMTLHGSVGLKEYGEERSRQVLQHGVGEWIERSGAEFVSIQDADKKRRAEVMRRNLIEMGRGRGDVGFSLEG